MKPKHTKVLGIAVGERSMLLAEVHAGSPMATVARCAEFRYPAGQSLKDAEALGAALARFLKDHDFGPRNAVFGLPAKWVLSKQKEIPTTDPHLLADTLRLQATAEFSPEFNDLVYDYSGTPAKDGTNSVLLMAVSGKYVSQITAIAEQAHLKPVGMAPSVAALASASAHAGGSRQTLLLGPSGIEFAAEQAGSPRVLRYISAGAEASPALVGEIRRVSAQAPRDPSAANGREMLLWNDAGANADSFGSLGESLGVALRAGQLRDLGTGDAPASADGHRYAAAIALAASGLSGRLPVDFLHSRLQPPPEKSIDRRLVLAIAAAAVIILGTIYWAASLHSQQADLDAQQQALNQGSKTREARQKEVSRIEFARGWHAEDPRFVSCMRDLTNAVPDSGDLYGTSLVLKDDMTGTFSGKAHSELTILDLGDRMRHGHFNPVTAQSMDPHVDPKAGREVSFVIVFTYLPPK